MSESFASEEARAMARFLEKLEGFTLFCKQMTHESESLERVIREKIAKETAERSHA